MSNVIKKMDLWGRIKRHLIRLLEDKDTSLDAPYKHKDDGATIKKNPGLDCPRCNFRIIISIEMLLSGDPVVCPNCGLKLSVDQEKSNACLNALRKVNNAVKEAEAVKRINK